MEKTFYPIVLNNYDVSLLRMEAPEGWVKCGPHLLLPGDQILVQETAQSVSYALKNLQRSLILSVVFLDKQDDPEALIQISYLFPHTGMNTMALFPYDVIYRKAGA
jgi:hypothetical protein